MKRLALVLAFATESQIDETMFETELTPLFVDNKAATDKVCGTKLQTVFVVFIILFIVAWVFALVNGAIAFVVLNTLFVMVVAVVFNGALVPAQADKPKAVINAKGKTFRVKLRISIPLVGCMVVAKGHNVAF